MQDAKIFAFALLYLGISNGEHVKLLFNLIVVFIATWVLLSIGDTARYSEYYKLIDALERQSVIGDCNISISSERAWIASWNPESVDVSIEHSGKTLKARTSKFFKPDRTTLPNRLVEYHFDWSQGVKGLPASALKITVNREYLIQNAFISYCERLDSTGWLINNPEKCEFPVEQIECS